MIIAAISFLVAARFSVADAVQCRVCANALVLNDCTSSVDCQPNEECYLDEIVTKRLTIVFNAGCRAKDVCRSQSSSNPIGKRKTDHSGGLIACSRCCEDNVTNGMECNSGLCSIKPIMSPLAHLRCRRCDLAVSLDNCTSVQCSRNEACYMDEVVTDQLSLVYNGGCRDIAVCSSATFSVLGKRDLRSSGNLLIACSRCCNATVSSTGMECNSRLCGIKGGTPLVG